MEHLNAVTNNNINLILIKAMVCDCCRLDDSRWMGCNLKAGSL